MQIGNKGAPEAAAHERLDSADNNHVSRFVNAKKDLFSYFSCKEDYSCRPLIQYKWSIEEDGDLYVLAYWKNKQEINRSAIVKKDGKPLIYKTVEHTMIIAIDCIKIAFVFKNTNKQE